MVVLLWVSTAGGSHWDPSQGSPPPRPHHNNHVHSAIEVLSKLVAKEPASSTVEQLHPQLAAQGAVELGPRRAWLKPALHWRLHQQPALSPPPCSSPVFPPAAFPARPFLSTPHAQQHKSNFLSSALSGPGFGLWAGQGLWKTPRN